MHLYKKISARSYIALIASVKFRIGGPKTARKVQVVRTKSNTGSKFSEIFFEPLYTGWIVVVHLYCGFSLWRQMAPLQSENFRTAFLGQFHTSLRKDSVANYASIWTLVSVFASVPDVLCNALNNLQFRR